MATPTRSRFELPVIIGGRFGAGPMAALVAAEARNA